MENIINVKAEAREQVGKKVAKKLRREDRVPAIIYGGKKETIPISISREDLSIILRSEKGNNAILRIHRADVIVDAMLKEIQYDYLQDTPIHVDLIRIDLKKEVDISVPVTIVGDAIGVREEDGIFDFVTRSLDLRCLPTQIPNTITVDVSELHAGNSIKLEDVDIPGEIHFLSDPRSVICAVTSKVAEEVEEVEEVETVEGEEAESSEEETPAEEA